MNLKNIKTKVHLSSVGANTVGGSEAGLLEVIYGALLSEFGQTFYKHISIHHIGEELDLSEFVANEGAGMVHVNIKYPIVGQLTSKAEDEQNRIRLEILHSGLMRIAEKFNKLDVNSIEGIKAWVLEKNFGFDIVCKEFEGKKNNGIKALLMLSPGINEFKYYLDVLEQGQSKCKIDIYSGKTDLIYVNELFSKGTWKNDKELVITGKQKQVDIRCRLDTCTVEYINLTTYPKAPLFELMKSNISIEDRDKAFADWSHSLPPGLAGMIRRANN